MAREAAEQSSETEQLVRGNISSGDVVVLDHAARQMIRRGIAVDRVLATIATALVVELYPHDADGPALLMLHRVDGEPVHVVWRIEAATAGPVLLVTAYRPDLRQWRADFRSRIGG